MFCFDVRREFRIPFQVAAPAPFQVAVTNFSITFYCLTLILYSTMQLPQKVFGYLHCIGCRTFPEIVRYNP